MEGICSIETSFSLFPNPSCESINATDEKLNNIGSFVLKDQQPESSSILMRGPNLADTSGFTGGRSSGPDKSADRPNVGGGFGNSTSPPEILDRGSRTSNEPATPVKSPQTEKPPTPSKGNTNSSETKVPPAPPETKKQQTSSEVPTKQILDKGDQLKDKMQSMKENQPLEAAPINTNQVEKGFLSKIWENINSNNDDIVMPPSKEVQKEHDHTPSLEKPSIQTIRDNESISKLDMQNSQQSEKGFLQTVWDNLTTQSDDVVMPPKSPETNTASMNQAALNETPTSNDERVVNITDQTKVEEKGLLGRLLEYFITDTNSIVCNSYFQKPELQFKTAGLPPLKREEFQNVGDMVLKHER